MPAKEIEIANAVVAELNDGARSWAGQFTAERRWLVIQEGEKLETLRVVVVCPALAQDQIARARKQREYQVLISMGQWVDARPDVMNRPDELTNLAETIFDFFSDDHALATLTSWRILGTQRRTVYDFEQLYTESTWETLIELNVRGYYG